MSGAEVDSLLGELERIRRTFAWKTADLDAAGLRPGPGEAAAAP